MRVLSDMTIQARTRDVLAALMKNRASHIKVVTEARVGYAKKARETLMDQIKKLKANKRFVVFIHLPGPQDHTKVYDTAIEMMKLHTEEKVSLNSTQVRNLMMDEWDWKSDFLHTNSAYSATAAAAVADADAE